MSGEENMNRKCPNGLTSDSLREQGNTLYKDGKVLEAIEFYSKAATQAPTDPKPHSNLSAAHFEIGDYRQCIADISNAISTSGDANADLRRKLAPRLMKAHLHMKNVQGAEATRSQLKDHPDNEKFSAACTNIRTALKTCRRAVPELIQQVPRYLSTLHDNPEYYAVGHDDICSQVDDVMMQKATDDPTSLFFGGIGDARNLYATLIDITRFEETHKGPSKRKFHMTVNDHKASMLARDLVMFYLLDELSNLIPDGGPQEVECLTVIFYLFAGAIVPPFVAQKIQDTVKRAYDALCSGDDVLEWVQVDNRSMGAICKSLDSWQDNLKSTFTTSSIVAISTKQVNESYATVLRTIGRPKYFDDCNTLEMEFFGITGALWPPKTVVDAHEPLLQVNREDSWKSNKKYVCQNWEVNVTLIDGESSKSRRWEWVSSGVGFDPFEMKDAFQVSGQSATSTKSSCLYDDVAPFFHCVAKSIQKLRNRLTVEVIVGEVTVMLDKIQHCLLDREDLYPQKYDRVHLSNIP
ncbi:MAG: hypothetical protein Q9174_006190 [Haloplaca sp. 1 TL-2023]